MAKLFASLFVMLLAATSVRAAPCGGDFNGFLAAMARDAPGQGVSGDPSYAFALLQDPGRSGRTSPLASRKGGGLLNNSDVSCCCGLCCLIPFYLDFQRAACIIRRASSLPVPSSRVAIWVATSQ